MPSKSLFVHPVAGESSRDASMLAVLWEPGTTPRTRSKLLQESKLKLIASQGRDAPRINQTDALSWVQSTSGKAITTAAIRNIEQSERVRWVAGIYKAKTAPKGLDGMYCVNPTRVYVSQEAESQLTEVTELRPDVSQDAGRTARLRGQVALNLEKASLAEGRTVVELAGEFVAKLKKAEGLDPKKHVRFETIPLLSPECAVPSRLEYMPDDPHFADQWALRRINATHAWNQTMGDPDVVVAVLDTGVELGHPDLNLYPESWNTTFDTPDGSPTGNHGTACAGIVAGVVDNAMGVAGVAGRCRIMAIATATWADVDIAEGLYFAADHGAKVVSMSFGVYPSWGMWDFDLIRDAMQYALERGVVLVAASGNENQNVSRFPGSDARTLCVGGVNRENIRKQIGDTSIENWWGACYGPDVDVVAPCLEIYTTDRLGASGYGPGDYYDRFNGTSSATPLVAGVAALIISAHRDLSNEEVRETIETTCDKIRPGTYTYNYEGHKANGTWNEEVGYGLVNAERALLAADSYGKAEEKEACRKECIEIPPAEKACVGPASPPWKASDSCLIWYENRFVSDPTGRCQIRIVYEHCLRLLGRQQGPLIYTMTLLPGETVKLYTYDRYRRVRSESQRMSIHASLRQTVASLWESKVTQRESRYQEFLETVRSDDDASISIGGTLFPVSWNVDDPDPTYLSLLVGASTETVASQFQQTFQSATQQLEAERSIVVSTYEESDQRDVTSRTMTNANECHAVTYYFRRVYESYDMRTRVTEITWRSYDPERKVYGPWRPMRDMREAADHCLKYLSYELERLPKEGEEIMSRRTFSVPTDGTVLQTELARCSSCDPGRRTQIRIDLQAAHDETRRLRSEIRLLELEAQRRRALLDSGDLSPFEVSVICEPTDEQSPAGEAEGPGEVAG